MNSIQTKVALALLRQARSEHEGESLDPSIANVVVALEELVAITQEIAPYGTDARFDAWCIQHLINEPKKECPSDHDEPECLIGNI